MNNTKHVRAVLMSILMLFSGLQLFAQELTISGTVIDKLKEPIIGANVVVQGTTAGTITDFDGNFTLANVPANGKIVVSYIGMKSQTIDVKGKTVFNITLEDNAQALEEVVVVGFGAVKKENLTGSVSQVKMSEVLGDRPISNAASALQGAVPGLQISGSSAPGQSKSFNIRGEMSINGGSPLVLIDNVEGDIDMLNPEDIESISVLKDAASSAIYGARAANGVILITTKRPAKGEKFKLSYNNNFGFESAINRPEQASLDTYLKGYQDAQFGDAYWSNQQSVTKWREYLAAYKQNPSQFNTVGDGIYIDPNNQIFFLNENDLYSNMLETGFLMNHNISISGGTDKLRYRISGGYNSEDGPLYSSKDVYQRFSLGAFLSAELTKWFTQEIDIKYARTSQELLVNESGNFNSSLFNTKLVSYTPEGSIPSSITGAKQDLPVLTPRNIIKNSNTSDIVKENPRIFLKSIFKPIKNLDAIVEYTYDKRMNNLDYYSGKWDYTTIQLNESTMNTPDYYIKRSRFTDYHALNIYGSYAYSINDHNLKLTAGFNQESNHYESLLARSSDQMSPTTPTIAGGKIQNTVNETKVYTIRGAFYRLNWNYKNRYMLESNGRYDGSSKFPSKNRFGFFPSVSAGWQIAEEAFMQPASNWLNGLKLRASWGQIGNQNIDPYKFYPSMDVSVNKNWLQNGEYQNAVDMPGLVSSNFTWETVTTTNFGLDWTLLNSRLRGTIDVYRRNTTGMLYDGLELPAVVGTAAPLQNVAEMRTDGWELSLNWNDKIGKVGYRIGINVFDHTSEITKINNESGAIYDKDKNNAYYPGYKLGTIYGYLADGYYTADDFTDGTYTKLKDGVASIKNVSPKPGDMKFKNLSDASGVKNEINAGNNTVSDMGDMTIVGNNKARFQYGANIGVNYAGFDLSVILQGTGKRDYWLGQNLFPFGGNKDAARNSALMSHQTDYWTPENPNARYFRIYDQLENSASNTRISDKYLQSAAYMRIKNITLAYTFNKEILTKLHLGQLKMFASAENVATISSLPNGYDPERLQWGYPFYRTISFGLNLSF